jgi:hypothetical protein
LWCTWALLPRLQQQPCGVCDDVVGGVVGCVCVS